MRRLCFWIAAWLAVGLSACTTLRPPPPPLDTAKACADWRWIAIKDKPDAQCPAVRGWTVRPLFPQVASVQKLSKDYCPQNVHEKVPVPDPAVIQELNRFCVYEASDEILGKRPFTPDASAGLVRFDQDCAALSTTSGKQASKEESWARDSDHFLAQAGALKERLKIDNPFGVRLAFLDTEPTHEEIRRDEPGREESWHGYTLAHIARHLVCTSESCAARITTQLALPIINFNPKSKESTEKGKEGRGGYLGTYSDLATAITNEVEAWQRARQWERAERHLVLNLSLAWDGELFGGLDQQQITEMQAGTQAVYRALQYAAGFDVLVLAAAGNQKAEPCVSFGPLLPAAWESGATPEERCSERVRKAPPPPLLYAVGGVQSDGHPLANARPGGMPRRAAYGENAVVASFDLHKPTAILTGSSVATAVVSSIAAVVWSSFPNHDSRWVMEMILDKSGDELLHLPADFWAPTTSTDHPKVHRLSLCKALAEACHNENVPVADCPAQLPCEPWSPEPFAFPSLSDPKRSAPGSCQPWLYPQPEEDPCPNPKGCISHLLQ